mmetsp:Transcript_14761/g.44455  ORF Transcript_14761/g.44455 Transcript_14761/m.44455 type:complete len:227 (+) Transcript_14761:463-1143(+)
MASPSPLPPSGNLQDVLERVDVLAGLLDVLADHLRDELKHELPQVALGGLLRHALNHAAADGLDLRALGVASLLELVLGLLGEADAEHAQDVAIRGAHVAAGLDERLPLADDRADLVAGHVHAVEVGEDVVALHILADEADLTVGAVLVLVEVGQVHLEHAALERIGGDLGTGGAVHKGLASHAIAEEARGDHGVPLLAREGIDDLLLATLLALGKALVLADSHGV